MIYTIFGFDYLFDLNFFRLCLLAAALGLFSKYLITIVKIDYFSMGNNTILIFSLLPVTGFVITSAISNNIALSLGMVGALSIVRFRTPIKNPLELVIYFFLITLGIVTNVDPNIAVNFTLFFACVVIISEVYRIISSKLNFNSINNRTFNFYLRLEVKEDILNLDNSENLLHKSSDSGSKTYNIGFTKLDKLYVVFDQIDPNLILNYSIDKSAE